MSERLAREVHKLRLSDDAIVVGSGPLDGLVRDARNLDMVVTPDVFMSLRASPVWEDGVSPNGSPTLTNGLAEVGMLWGDRTADDLLPGSFAEHGVRFAGLPDVYSWKQTSGSPKDTDDLAAIKQRLFDRPLPPTVLHRELDFVTDCVPAELSGHPALAVAANGLYIVRTLYGNHKSEVHHYNGSVEQHSVPALYHEYQHSANGVERIARHAARTNAKCRALGQRAMFSASDTLASMAAFAYHDAHLGDGRQSNNPSGFDELVSAQLVARHLTLAGCTEDEMPDKSYAGVRATAFNEATKRQDVDPARGYIHIQEAMVDTDLSSFTSAAFACDTMRLAAEDLCRVGGGNERKLAALAITRKIPIRSMATALALIDSSPELRLAFADYLAGSAEFCRNHKFTGAWTLASDTLRQRNAAFAADISRLIAEGRLNATQAYQLASQHVAAMTELAEC